MGGNGSGPCPMANFGIGGLEPSGSANTMLDRSFVPYSPHRKNKQINLFTP